MTVSDAEREREKLNPQKKNSRIQTQDLLNTSQMLLPLSHWAHGRGAGHKLHRSIVWRPQLNSNSRMDCSEHLNFANLITSIVTEVLNLWSPLQMGLWVWVA